jgi:hypothetical protein
MLRAPKMWPGNAVILEETCSVQQVTAISGISRI